MNKYSYTKTIKKGLKYFIIFILPLMVNHFIIAFPAVAQLTIGGVLVMVLDYLKNKANITMGGLL